LSTATHPVAVWTEPSLENGRSLVMMEPGRVISKGSRFNKCSNWKDSLHCQKYFSNWKSFLSV